MKKTQLTIAICLLIWGFTTLAQDTLFKSNPRATITLKPHNLPTEDTLNDGKALCFPSKNYGICIGNSKKFNGIRINLADKNVKKINGLNITLWFKTFKNENAVVNGVSIGLLPTAGSMQFINIGLLGIGTAHNNLNGLTIGGFIVGSGGNINGLSINGLVTMADGDNSVISGIVVSGLGIGARNAINGLAVGGVAIGTDGKINGIACSLAYISATKNFNGLAVTFGYLESEIYKGLAIAGYSKTNQMNGLSFSLFNRTKELHGVQLGIINYAENNPKWLRIMPLINFHFE